MLPGMEHACRPSRDARWPSVLALHLLGILFLEALRQSLESGEVVIGRVGPPSRLMPPQRGAGLSALRICRVVEILAARSWCAGQAVNRAAPARMSGLATAQKL